MTNSTHHRTRGTNAARLHARMLGALLVAALLLAACGDDDDSGATTSTTIEDTTTTSAPVGLEQPAIWPAADVVFATPEEAAEDFVREALGVEPALGEFQQGDSRSGEIEVLSLGEGSNAAPVVRSVLLLRQLGSDDGWFVIAAVNDNETITTPESMSEVAAGPVTVEGVGRGFEATVVVTAFVAGDATRELDQVVTAGGSAETPEPYSVSLDLADATAGDTVVLLVRGDTGLDSDPGDFAAIPVVIAG